MTSRYTYVKEMTHADRLFSSRGGLGLLDSGVSGTRPQCQAINSDGMQGAGEVNITGVSLGRWPVNGSPGKSRASAIAKGELRTDRVLFHFHSVGLLGEGETRRSQVAGGSLLQKALL